MTISTQTRGLRGSMTGALTTKRRQAGTSLVEILVVIVIFLIGILAVIQVFPGGFRLLLTTRSNSVATQMGRDEVERIKANPDLLPEEVLAVRYSGGVPVVDPGVDPLSVAPQGDLISSTGILTNGGTDPRDWMYASGANVARRIIGEGQRVPAPRQVGNDNGGLMLLDHGPIDPGPTTWANYPNIVAYANDLSRSLGVPRDAVPSAPVSGWNVSVPGGSNVANAQWVATPISLAPFEFFVVDASTPNAGLLLPTDVHDRLYRVRVSATIATAGTYTRVDYVSLSVLVPAMADLQTQQKYPLVLVNLTNLLTATPNAAPAGATVASAETDTIRVAPRYIPRTLPGWSGDPFEVKILNPNLGVLLFSPAAREGVVSRPGGVTEPLLAKVDYDVLDWRVLHEDFRVTGNATMQLALQSLKVGANPGPDGRLNGWIPGLETAASPTDNVVVVDVTTGGILHETGGDIKVDKSRGAVTINTSPAGTVTMDIPAGVGNAPIAMTGVSLVNRPLRVLYRARNEWSVQLIKGAAQYPLVNVLPTLDQFSGACFIGNGSSGIASHLYFPKSDVNRKITIDKIAYYDTADVLHVIEGQDFQIHYAVNDTLVLPCIELKDIDSAAKRFTGLDGELPPVTGVKGASLAVRVLWNPEAFTFTNDTNTNMSRVNVYNRAWRKSMTETYLRAEESR